MCFNISSVFSTAQLNVFLPLKSSVSRARFEEDSLEAFGGNQQLIQGIPGVLLEDFLVGNGPLCQRRCGGVFDSSAVIFDP